MQDPFAQSVAAIHEFVAGTVSLVDVLTRLANITVTAAGGSMVGLTLHDDAGRPITAARSDPVVDLVDDAQYDADDGPCLDAFRSMEMRRIDDTAKDDRWPDFCRVARSHGIQSTLSVPLIVADRGIGSLNIYGTQIGQFSKPSSAQMAILFGSQAAIAASFAEKADLAENLGKALETRAAIEQAKGIIMHTVGCSPDRAWEMLRSQSQLENVKVRDLAVMLVAQQERAQTGA